MTAEDWPRVEELFHNASRLGGAARDEYLARECAGDEALRREVESLVTAFESNHSFMERPLVSQGLRALYGGPAGSLAGCSLGHYKVLRLLGQGGMGEVYLAEDCLLERPVALKFINPGLVGDGWAKEQLMKEARAVAKLEHQNICAVYGVGEDGERDFIVMQYVEGETLDALLRREQLSLGRALDLAEQIVSALSAAHSRGIIHRDIKPLNIVVTAEGQAKVLDFGIAKLIRQKQGAENEGDAPVQLPLITGVLGTYAYASPEQLRGEELDHRSDIFSFGIVLYELLGGRNPFLRVGLAETAAAIITEDPPPLSYLPLDLTGGLERIARKCLEKEPARRYGTADQLLRDLRGLRGEAERKSASHVARAVSPVRFPALRRHAKALAASALALLLLLSSLAGYAYVKLSQEHTLAVLPIANASEDRDADYLTEVLTRNLYDKFSYLPRLKLKLPSVAPQLAARGVAPQEGLWRAGRELKADAVLTGTIIKQDGALRLRVVLLDTRDGAQMWERVFNLDPANLLPIQEETAREVASEMGLWLLGNALARRQTDDEEALRLYMYGRYQWSMRKGPGDVQKAIDYFERSVARDPSFAKAYAGLADCYSLRNNVAYGAAGVREAMEKAGYNARKAVEAGDSLPEAHTSLGMVRLRYLWEWDGAERELKRAVELNPDYAPAHYWYSNLLAALGRFDESVREAEVAKGLDPYSPAAHMNYGRALYYARRYEEAAAYLGETAGRYPSYPQFPHMLALVRMQQGRYDEAVATLEAMRPKHSRYADAALGFAYGRMGRPDKAAEMLRDIERLSTPEDPMPPLEWALVYIGMDDRGRAFEKLEEVYRGRFSHLAYLKSDPMYDSLRDDPRFADLARRVNLTP